MTQRFNAGVGMGFYFGEPQGGRQKICWFQAVPKAPNDTAVTYAFALYGTSPDQRADRDPEKAPARSAGRSARRGLSALLFDDGNQLETANQCIAIARAGRISRRKATARRDRHAPAGRGPAVLVRWGVALTDSFT